MYLSVPRGEHWVNTLAGVCVPIALSIGLVCENLTACCAHAIVVGRRTLVYKHVGAGISISGLNIGILIFRVAVST